jgi:hypothetical protein
MLVRRMLIGSLPLDEQEKVEKELIPYGLSVTNANISELRDLPGDDNRYFESLKQKAISGATNIARHVTATSHLAVIACNGSIVNSTSA